MIIKNETCQEYFLRRLAEGWECIEYSFPHAVLLSPEGIRREIDLRNDTLTLRPYVNATPIQLTAVGAAANWNCVNEGGSGNGDTDYVKNGDSALWKYDLYYLPDHTSESGTISKVTIYVRHKYSGGNLPKGRTVIKTESTEYRGSIKSLTSSYVQHNTQYANNPHGGAWTWTQIDALQAGWDGKAYYNTFLHQWFQARCTQVYVEVDFTPSIAHEKNLSDTVTISDSIVKAIGLNKSDSVAISDAIVKSIGLFKIDTVAIADTIVKAISLAKADTVTIADSISKAISLGKADTVTITDSISKRISIVKADAMAIADSIAVHIGLGLTIALSDIVTITDRLVGELRVKVYLKQSIARMQIKGLDIARMSIKKMGIDKMPLYRWITRRWTA